MLIRMDRLNIVEIVLSAIRGRSLVRHLIVPTVLRPRPIAIHLDVLLLENSVFSTADFKEFAALPGDRVFRQVVGSVLVGGERRQKIALT
jgi:hypothetical protein